MSCLICLVLFLSHTKNIQISNSTYLRLKFKSLSSGDAVSRNTIVTNIYYIFFFQKILIYFRVYCSSDSVFCLFTLDGLRCFINIDVSYYFFANVKIIGMSALETCFLLFKAKIKKKTTRFLRLSNKLFK